MTGGDTITARFLHREWFDFAPQFTVIHAAGLHADFTMVRAPEGYGPVDHDWMFDDPELFAEHLTALGLQALALPAR